PARTLAFDPTTGAPAWDHVLPSGRRMGLLVPADLATGFWEHGHLAPVDSFPSAPFLDRSVAELLFPEQTDRHLPLTPTDGDNLRLPEGSWKDWKVLTWSGEAGIHRWAPSGGLRPVLVSGRRPHFPVMRDLDEMIRATRYIAKRDEYQTMRKARDPKRALDEFWLQFGEDPEEARQLIATYYGRVREANVHFSGLKEGWCTDRGMVHIIFGHADRVRRDRIGETWIYGDEGDVNALVFRFSRRERGDDFNAFELERYPGFRSPWEAMVGSWRRGKVRKR
ncbi:MAG: GWxTD domain-containing protein, partial [Flavobacteriales bacterium]